MTTATVFDHPTAATHGHLLWQCVPETLASFTAAVSCCCQSISSKNTAAAGVLQESDGKMDLHARTGGFIRRLFEKMNAAGNATMRQK